MKQRHRATGFSFILIALGALSCLANSARAVPTVTIRGTAQLENGEPVEGAIVVTERGGRAVTGADGAFTLELSGMEFGADGPPVGVSVAAMMDGRSFSGDAIAHDSGRRGARDAGVITLQGDCEPAWLPMFGSQPGVFGQVLSFTVFDDGSGAGPALYVGGFFELAGGVTVENIARWDGSAWWPLGAGTNGAVAGLTVFDDGAGAALYACGVFTTAGEVAANGVAKWDGSAWSALGSGLNGTAWDIIVFDDGSGSGPAIHVGGQFTAAGAVAASNSAKWDGGSWSALGSGTDFAVHAFAVFDDGAGPALYAGGTFTTAGGGPANRVAKWDGSNWAALGVGLNHAVTALAVFDDGAGHALYAGGNFTTAGGMPASHIARWDGSAWSPIGSGMNGEVGFLTVIDDGSGDGPLLYAGGLFTNADGVAANRVARWAGATWTAIGDGMSNAVSAIALFDDGSGAGPSLYAGGHFPQAEGVPVNYIARWNSSNWVTLGGGLNAGQFDTVVLALAEFDDGSGSGPALYVGGFIRTAAEQTVNHIAKWSGSSWSALGSGMNGQVWELAGFDDGAGPALYAGGEFTTAGGTAVNRIAKWNGASWTALDSGMNGAVRTLATLDDGSGAGPALYAGGAFTTAGGVTVNRIARWNGASWSALGSGTSSIVNALIMFDDGAGAGPAIYVGGRFTTAGGLMVNRVARWDGAAWSALGSGVGNEVYALAVFDDGSGAGPALYAGGEFTTAGGAPANHIARWDGSTWTAVGGGLNDWAGALAVFDDGAGAGPALYAGGAFTAAEGGPANRFARWNGASWSQVDSGMTDWVRILLPVRGESGSGAALLVGGDFSTSPSNDSFLAKWQGCLVEAPACPADLDGDGAVGSSDLASLLGSWGATGGPADLDGSGVVSAGDLAVLLGSWGPC